MEVDTPPMNVNLSFRYLESDCVRALAEIHPLSDYGRAKCEQFTAASRFAASVLAVGWMPVWIGRLTAATSTPKKAAV
jgi:hypothetical protein